MKKYALVAFVGATLVVAIIASSVLLAARNNSDLVAREQQSSSTQVAQRIIGGYEAVEDRYSYAVSLQGSIGHICGGSLIARDVILTAAHCQGEAQSVVLGRHDLDEYYDGDAFSILAELPHPEYDEILSSNDFMLVFLDGHSTAEDVVTVRLNSDPSVPAAGRDVTVVGWGDTDISEVEDVSDVLMKVVVTVVSNDECGSVEGSGYSYEGRITKSMMCALADGRDSCQGDSGGPLVIRGGGGVRSDVQVGIVSWGIGCAYDHFPGIYARVSQAYDWIEREVCAGSNHASEAGFDCSGGGRNNAISASSLAPPTSPPITASNDGIVSSFGIIYVDSSDGDSVRDGNDDDEPT